MAFFLKKTVNNKGTYLQIYESFYDPERKETAQHSHGAIGYVSDLQQKGIDDPIAYYQHEVDLLNQQFHADKAKAKQKKISSDESPEKLIGYFPLKCINDSLGVKKYIDLMQSATSFQFKVFEMISALVYARAVYPCSKSKTYDEVLPKLLENYTFSESQLYEGLEYIGYEYEKIIEIYNHQITEMYGFDTSHCYFDCTNFYFEIDKEDNLRRKGPSKEGRKDPIVGMGLLLDANLIPIGMKIFPGNKSEKPIMRDVVDGLKQRNNIKGRTIQIADKGLNCSENIFNAITEADGYIFSKSVKQLPEKEKVWVLLDNDYRDIKDSNGKLIYRIKECIDDFPYYVTDIYGKRQTVYVREKRIVTYNPKLAKKKEREIRRQADKAVNLTVSQAKRSEFGDNAKYVSFVPVDRKGEKTDGKVKASLNEEKIQEDLALAGYNLLVTSEINMSATDVYDAYHNLWRIEESFKIMKSQLDARPVHVQKEKSIVGHFLICYLAVLLERILQFKVFGNTQCTEAIFDFIKGFKVVQVSDRKFINLSKGTDFGEKLADSTGLPIMSYFLTPGQINEMLSYSF